MEELVIVVLQMVGEFAIEVLVNLPLSSNWRRTRSRDAGEWRALGPTLASSADTARRVEGAPRRWPAPSPVPVWVGLWAGAAWLCVGMLIGGLMSWAWPHTFLPNAALRLGNLVVAPVVAAIIAEWIARHRADTDPDVVPRQHFWRAFWFTLGLAGARLAGAAH